MPILYEDYQRPKRRRLQITEKRYETGLPDKLTIGFWDSMKSAERKVDVRWDEKYTLLHQALLYVKAHGNVPFPSPAFQARWYVNGHPVITLNWTGPESCTVKDSITNIGAHLINGMNTFKIELVKGVHLPGTPSIRDHSCYFVAQFTGEPPSVKPEPTLTEKLITYGIIGTVALGGLYVGTKVIAERRRRKT